MTNMQFVLILAGVICLVLFAIFVALHYGRAKIEARRPGRPTCLGVLFMFLQALCVIGLLVVFGLLGVYWFLDEFVSKWPPLPTPAPWSTPTAWPTFPR